jgi:hypothetical protein
MTPTMTPWWPLKTSMIRWSCLWSRWRLDDHADMKERKPYRRRHWWPRWPYFMLKNWWPRWPRWPDDNFPYDDHDSLIWWPDDLMTWSTCSCDDLDYWLRVYCDDDWWFDV